VRSQHLLVGVHVEASRAAEHVDDGFLQCVGHVQVGVDHFSGDGALRDQLVQHVLLELWRIEHFWSNWAPRRWR
jgi:hypothetical protein